MNKKERQEKQRLKDEARMLHRRLKIHRSLRAGNHDRHTLSHTVRFKDKEVQITEAEYLWLIVRDHLGSFIPGLMPRVIDETYIHLRDDHHADTTDQEDQT